MLVHGGKIAAALPDNKRCSIVTVSDGVKQRRSRMGKGIVQFPMVFQSFLIVLVYPKFQRRLRKPTSDGGVGSCSIIFYPVVKVTELYSWSHADIQVVIALAVHIQFKCGGICPVPQA